MFKIGDLVKITNTSFNIEGIDDKEWFDKVAHGKIGLVVEKDDNNPENTLYLISLSGKNGSTYQYYYYEHELEFVG